MMIHQEFPQHHARPAAGRDADDHARCWFWIPRENIWKSVPDPCWISWIPNIRYHVGHAPPDRPPRRLCRLAGLTYPLPLDHEPPCGAECFLVELNDRPPQRFTWGSSAMDPVWLSSGQLQATEAGAIEQRRAMRAALQQAVQAAA